MSDEQLDYERNWEEFWEGIVCPDEFWDFDQVKRELFDFYMLIGNAGRVFDHVTGGQVSKPLTDSKVVNALADEYYQGVNREHYLDLLRDLFIGLGDLENAHWTELQDAVESLLENWNDVKGDVGYG